MTDRVEELIERLRRIEYFRRSWHEPHGEVDVPCDADMADWPGVETKPVNPDGPAAADMLAELRDAGDALLMVLNGTLADVATREDISRARIGWAALTGTKL